MAAGGLAGQTRTMSEQRAGTALARLAVTAAEVAAESGRSAKAKKLGELLATLQPDEIEPAIGMLTASPRQGAIGVGWATVAKVGFDDPVEPDLSLPAPTVGHFDDLLSELQSLSGPGSDRRRRELLSDFAARCDVTTRRFVARVLTGEARLGALAGVMIDAVAKATGIKAATIRRGVMLRGDLGATATLALTDGVDAVEALDIVVGRPILPMLASTASSPADAIEATGDALVEWKLDGARIQVHIDHGDNGSDRGTAAVTIVTRNLNDVTGRLPSVVAVARSLNCRSAVLDGEVIGWGDDDTDAPDRFQDTIARFSTDPTPGDNPNRSADLRPFFFDLLVLDGVSLIDRPLAERSEQLRRLAPDHCIPMVRTDDPHVAADHLTAALDAGHEGVMIKAADSVYEAGRRGKAWRKVKPVHTFDLVILGVEWGSGRRRGKLSNLHLGARDPDGGFVMVGKTFKGLTDELLDWQTENFPGHADVARSTTSTVMLHPHFVAEIAIDGVQRSTRYPGGVALRFARLKRYRHDKDPAQADTITSLQAML